MRRTPVSITRFPASSSQMKKLHAYARKRAAGKRTVAPRALKVHTTRRESTCSVARESNTHADATGKNTHGAACTERVGRRQDEFRVAAVRHAHAMYKAGNEEAEDAQKGR